MKHKSGFKSVVMVVMLLVIFTDVASAVMGQFGGKWQYSGNITMDGEMTFRTEMVGPYYKMPVGTVTMLCPIRIDFSQCDGDILRVNNDGSTTKITNVRCEGAGTTMKLGLQGPLYPLNAVFKLVLHNIKARYTPMTNDKKIDLNICPMDVSLAYEESLVSSTVMVRMTTDSGYHLSIPLYRGLQLTSIPANSGSGTALIEYTPGLVLNTLPDGSVRGEVLRMVSDTTSASIRYSVVQRGSGAQLGRAQLIKRDGSDCRSLVQGDTCDLYFPPGAVPAGQLIEGLINIAITTY